MLNLWEWWMDGIKKFGYFKAMNFRRILGVLFQIIPMVLGGLGCGISKRLKRQV